MPTAFSGRDIAIVVSRPHLKLTDDECISLRHLTHFLGEYDRYLVGPRSVRGTLEGFETRRFPDKYFRSHRANSALFVTRDLYSAFAEYKFILVYELDALVFSNRLLEWCKRGFDFVGAPWLYVDWLEGPPRVGNGGFSLRRVEAFLEVFDSEEYWLDPEEYWRTFWGHRAAPLRWLNLPRGHLKRLRRFNGVSWETRRWIKGSNTTEKYGWHEDVFWSFEAPRYDPSFRIASVEEALRFSFEAAPRRCLELTGGELPFGCHAWNRYDRAFWEPYLLR